MAMMGLSAPEGTAAQMVVEEVAEEATTEEGAAAGRLAVEDPAMCPVEAL